jgi:hypothetical protein
VSRIQCFLLEKTDRVRLRLRRFTYGLGCGERASDPCPAGPMGGHDATVPFRSVSGDDLWPAITRGAYLGSYEHVAPAHDDPRWPALCQQCSAPMPACTEWQVFQERIWRRTDTGSLLSLREAPPGAMWIADWLDNHLQVALPPGGGMDYWDVDGSASNGPGWTRTGEPPNVTAAPSILTPRYHGYLRGGFLESC